MAEIAKIIQEKVERYGRERKALIPILQGIVVEKKYVDNKDMVNIAKALDLSAADVYGTASFYSFLDTKPRGKYIIRVCQTITCEMKGKKELIQTLENLLKIKLGETSPNGMFSLLATNCLGWCHKAPAMLINDDIYTELDNKKVKEIIGEIIRQKC